MPGYTEPIQACPYTFRLSVQDLATAGAFLSNPSVGSGKWKVDIDGGGLNNLATAASVSPASTVCVKITLNAAEMNGNVITIVGIDTAATKLWADKTISLVTKRLPILHSGTAQAGAATTITLASSAPAYDLTGCIVRTTGGTGGGGTGGANNQAAVIISYDTSTKVATVSDTWGTNPASDTTYDILLTDLACNAVAGRFLRPATDGRTLVVDANGLADANTVKVGPSGSGTAQTALDIGGNWTAARAAHLDADISSRSTLTQTQVTGGAYSVQSSSCVLGDARIAHLDADISSRMATFTLPANFASLGIGGTGHILNVDTLTTYTNNTPQSGDAYADTETLLGRLTSARAGYLDNLNVGGAVASHADITAINQSASKHVLLATVGQYERPESGTTTYTVEARTFSASTGAAVNADSTPTLTATGQTSGDLSANLGVASNPATGVYRWTYTVANNATIEPVRMDVSATIASSTFTLSAYTQVVDVVSATWTSTDASHLTGIFNKLPSNNIADETLVLAAVGGIPTNPLLTNDSRLNHLDADISTRSTLTQAQVTGGAYSVQSSSCVLGDARLAHLDADISGRASATVAPSWYSSPTTPPTTAQIVTAIFTALTAGSDFQTAGSVGKLIVTNLDTTVGSRLPTSSYVAPDNSDIAAIKAKTDSLQFTVGGMVDANIRYVNSAQVTGTGQSGNRWGPA